MPRKKPKLTLVTDAESGIPPARELGEHGRALWDRVMQEYAIEDCGGLEMLLQACAALDRAERLQALIQADGEVIDSPRGLRDHPALKHELANRSFVVRTLARLGLDVEAIKPVGRPSAQGYRG